MSQKAIEGFVGPIWVLCGVVMATSPPLANAVDASRRQNLGQYSQLFGVLIAVAGVYMAIRGLRGGGGGGEGRVSRRTRAAWTPRQRLIVGGVALFGVALAAVASWQAASTREPAMLSLVVFVLSICVILAPRAVDGLRGDP
jgi:small neutral amino acid transporter SnatA (MarC family)